MTSLRHHLVLSYLAIIALGAGGAAAATWIAVEQAYLSTQAANLRAQAAALSAGLDGGLGLASAPYSQASNTLPGIHVHLLPAQGALTNITHPPELPVYVAGNPADSAQAVSPVLPAADASPPLFSRSEIIAAHGGQVASAIRDAGAGNRRVLYAAAPVRSADGARVTGLVYLATPLPTSGWSALEPRTRWGILALLAGLVAAAGAAGWALAARLARPLAALSSAACAVAAGNLDHTVPEPSGPRELRDLGRAFNAMTGSLHRADQVKKAFVADVSHELRTPLTIIKGTIETLQDGAVDDLAVREGFLASVAGETDRLIKLVNDLLILNRAEAGALRPEREPTDMVRLARERADRFAALAAGQDCRIAVEAADDALWASADAHQLAQVLDNLLHNAIRHAPGGSIRVTVAGDGEGVRCCVADNGSGIPPAHLPHIFERFYRVDGSRTRASGGAGLGLAITQALIQAHGGRIDAASPEGRGAHITFWLPRAEG